MTVVQARNDLVRGAGSECSISVLAATVRKAIKRPAGAHVDPAIEDRGSREDIFVKIIDGENIPIRSGPHHDNLSILAHDEAFSIGGDGRRPVAADCPGKTPLLEDFSVIGVQACKNRSEEHTSELQSP